MLDYYQSRVPLKYREYKTTVFLSVAATCSIAILSCEYQCNQYTVILIHIDVSPSIESIRSDVD